jgi:plastocyanin
MRPLTPTLVICALAAATTAGLLALEPERSSTPTAAAATVPAGAAAPAAAQLVSESFTFAAPVVAAGGTIEVVNRDSVEHTVSADDGSFDVAVGGGGTTTLTAPAAPGSYRFVCAIHPAMTATVTVA